MLSGTLLLLDGVKSVNLNLLSFTENYKIGI